MRLCWIAGMKIHKNESHHYGRGPRGYVFTCEELFSGCGRVSGIVTPNLRLYFIDSKYHYYQFSSDSHPVDSFSNKWGLYRERPLVVSLGCYSVEMTDLRIMLIIQWPRRGSRLVCFSKSSIKIRVNINLDDALGWIRCNRDINIKPSTSITSLFCCP